MMWNSSSDARILFSRSGSVADFIERALLDARRSIDTALYRLDLPRLARALQEANRKTVRLRLIIDWGKYHQSADIREIVARNELPFRLCGGRKDGAKMHHKFVVIDGRMVLTGSYNWTRESELNNYENLVVLSEPQAVEAYAREFEALWAIAKQARTAPAAGL